MLSLLLRVLDGFPGSAGAAVPYGDEKVCVVDHVAVAFLHAVWCVSGLQQNLTVAFGKHCIIPVAQRLRPLLCLRFTGQRTGERDVRVGGLQAEYDLSGIHIRAKRHAGDKVRHVFGFDVFDDLCAQELFERGAALIRFVEAEREFLRAMTGKCSGFLFHILMPPMY